jgi:predicted nucleotidyltransferase
MRLSSQEVVVLKNTLQALSESAQLYLFGSRVDDSKRGGDIDLLVVDKTLTQKDLRKLRIDFCQMFGEQKMDILLDDGSFTDPFHQIARQGAIKL